MDSITVPTAAKPATSALLTFVTTERSRIQIKLPNDPRLVQALAGAVEHSAARAGFVPEAAADLAFAAEAACRDTFKLLSDDHDLLAVTLDSFPDRIEVILEHHGEALPTVGLDTFADPGSGGDLSGLALLARVDRVQYHTEGGTSRMTLVKYLPAARAKK